MKKKVKKAKKSVRKPVAELTVYDEACKLEENSCNKSGGGCFGALYGLGVIGSAVYYIGSASSFWVGVWGVVKSLVWPAFLVYEVLKFVGA